MRLDWKRINWLRILGILMIAISIGAVIWQIPQVVYTHEQIMLLPGYLLLVSALIIFCAIEDIKHKRYIFITQILSYFAIYLLVRKFIYLKGIHLGIGLILLALCIGIIHLAIEQRIKKNKKNTYLSAIQIALLFSGYSMFSYGGIHGTTIWDLFPRYTEFGLSALLIISIIAALPEIIGILALFLMKRKRIIAGGILMLFMIIILIELFPLRLKFIHIHPDDMVSCMFTERYEKFGKTFGNPDKEAEFTRSLHTIEHLVTSVKKDQSKSYQTVIMNIPDLHTNPTVLSLKWCTEHLYGFPILSEINFDTLVLDVNMDSDGDGLTDFLEAALLSDARDEDTDDDGFIDGRDSDPLNPYKDTKYAHVNAAILEYLTKKRLEASRVYTLGLSGPYYEKKTPHLWLIINDFWEGHGEIGNFKEHVLILEKAHFYLWTRIFTFYEGQFYWIRRHSYSILGQYAIVQLSTMSDAGGGDYLVLLMKWKGQWSVVGWQYMYVWI